MDAKQKYRFNRIANRDLLVITAEKKNKAANQFPCANCVDISRGIKFRFGHLFNFNFKNAQHAQKPKSQNNFTNHFIEAI